MSKALHILNQELTNTMDSFLAWDKAVEHKTDSITSQEYICDIKDLIKAITLISLHNSQSTNK